MRTLSRNKQTIYYSLLLGKNEVTDENGNITGSYELIYANPEKLEINVSASKGSSDKEQFGINDNYTKMMVTNDINCPIREDSKLWVDIGTAYVFNANTVYKIGDLVVFEDCIYKCINGTTGDFDDSNWEKVPYNYCVTKVAKSLNSILYAIREVNVQ